MSITITAKLLTGGDSLFKKISILLCTLMLFYPITCYADDTIYLGGDSIGIEVDYDGILISGTYPFQVHGKTFDPSSSIQPKDIIKEVNGVRVHTLDELYAELNKFQNEINEVPLTIERNASQVQVSLTTIFDSSQKSFKSGLYVKDKIVGVGTLTYYDPSNQTYGALGHEIMDSDIKEIADVHHGNLYPASVISIQKAQNNIPGEKHAQINFQQSFANVLSNTSIGIYGQYTNILRDVTAMPWANHNEVATGDAVIYTVLKGNEIEAFNIRITKVNKQDSGSVKGIEFEIHDERLASLTNGIVQGMSGSPIVQNGKIIGAVTHVVTSHPLNGYGVYIEWMLQESRKNV